MGDSEQAAAPMFEQWEVRAMLAVATVSLVITGGAMLVGSVIAAAVGNGLVALVVAVSALVAFALAQCARAVSRRSWGGGR